MAITVTSSMGARVGSEWGEREGGGIETFLAWGDEEARSGGSAGSAIGSAGAGVGVGVPHMRKEKGARVGPTCK
jgi:hypothetical protein